MEHSHPVSNIVAITITKNESAEIVGWLDTCRQFSCCQIVADTGSTDNTKGLADSNGAYVVNIPWTGDFAAARNEALDIAAKHPAAKDCQWLAMFDADEHITPASAEKLMQIIQRYTSSIDKESDTAPEAISVSIINIDADDKYIRNREIHRFTAVRIFRNIPQLRYEGNIHEQLYFIDTDSNGNTIKRNPRTVIHPEIEVIHTGYSSNRVKEKILRNLELLQQDISVHGEGPRHYRYLADCYHGLEDYKSSLLYAELAISSPMSAGASDSDMYSVRLTCMRKLKYPLAEQIAAAKEAADKFPSLPDFAASLGELQLIAEEYSAAKENLQKSLALYEVYCQALASGTGSTDGLNASFFAEEPPNVHYRLALCHQSLGENDASRQEILTALSSRPKTIEYLIAAEEILGENFLKDIAIPAIEQNPADKQFYLDFADSLGAVKLRQKLNDITVEGATSSMSISTNALQQCIESARRNTELLFLTALELASVERNEEAAAAVSQLCPPLSLLIETLINGDIDPLLASPLRKECSHFWCELADAVSLRATEDAAMQFAVLAPVAVADDDRLAAARLFYKAERWSAAASVYGTISTDSSAFSDESKREYIRLILRLMEQDKWSATDTIGLLNSLFTSADYLLLCRAMFPLINLKPEMAPIYVYYGKKTGVDLTNPLLLLALKNYEAVSGQAAADLTKTIRYGLAKSISNDDEGSANIQQLSDLAIREVQTAYGLLKANKPLPKELANQPQVKALCRYIRESEGLID